MSRLPEGYDHIRNPQARRLQKRADWATDLRGELAPLVGASIVIKGRRWSNVAAAGGLMVLDYLDGRWAKKAQRLENPDNPKPLTDGARRDPQMDKVLMSALWGGTVHRAIIEDDLESFAAMWSIMTVDQARNEDMEASRQLVESDPALKEAVGVGARNINRAKMFGQAAFTLLNISPLANNRWVRRAALAGLGSSTGLGVVGAKQYAAEIETAQTQLAALQPFAVASAAPASSPVYPPAA